MTRQRPQTVIHLDSLFPGRARLAARETYRQQVLAMVPPGAVVTLTGAAPVWLYLELAHALHGRAAALYYESPVTGKIAIFNHDPC